MSIVPCCSIYRVVAMPREHGSPVDIAHMNGQQDLKQVLDICLRSMNEWAGVDNPDRLYFSMRL